MPLPKRILIANRGEIAVRVIRTCKAMGIETVAVYSEADREAWHRVMADQAYEIGPPPAAKSYLDMDAILAAAQKSGADAVHPGYGFLAENATFAERVISSGFRWIGPAPATIRIMGNKQQARQIAKNCGVPVLPGVDRIESDHRRDIDRLAAEVGLPLLVKAAAGGGGIGMRAVDSKGDLATAIEATQKVAERAFGDSAVFLERYVPNARHIEVQVFGFGNGDGLHVFTRDCTIQRRFQKVIEEAPAPGLSTDLRRHLHESALRLVEEQRYLGAGTVEFIYDCDRDEFYFLEMNTRIQVEHSVTEMITGIDLVRWQVEAAVQAYDRIKEYDHDCSGHGLECRLYAERPEANFLPSTGVLTRFAFPAEEGDLRIDTGLREGDRITPFYDPMIAKVITKGSTRREAIMRMSDALSRIEIAGVSTNLNFLREIIHDARFTELRITTRYIEDLQRHRTPERNTSRPKNAFGGNDLAGSSKANP